MKSIPIDYDMRDFAYAKIIKLPILCNLQREVFEKVFANFSLSRFSKGETLIKRGFRNPSLFLILRGKVSVHTKKIDGSKISLGVLQAPVSLGEMGLLLSKPPTATVKALNEVLALQIASKDFFTLFENVEGFGLNIAQGLSERVVKLSARYAEVQPAVPESGKEGPGVFL